MKKLQIISSLSKTTSNPSFLTTPSQQQKIGKLFSPSTVLSRSFKMNH